MTQPDPPFRPVSLRRAGPADARRVWTWRNEPAARAASFASDEVPWEVHQRWFAARVESDSTRIWIASSPAEGDIGYARFDVSDRTAEISVALDAATRGRRWGRSVIRAACEAEMGSGSLDRVVAHIKCDNDASLAAFRAAGFVVVGETVHAGTRAWVLEYEPSSGRRP